MSIWESGCFLVVALIWAAGLRTLTGSSQLPRKDAGPRGGAPAVKTERDTVQRVPLRHEPILNEVGDDDFRRLLHTACQKRW